MRVFKHRCFYPMWVGVTMSSFYFMALLVRNVHDDTESATDGHAPFMPKRQIKESRTVYKVSKTTSATRSIMTELTVQKVLFESSTEIDVDYWDTTVEPIHEVLSDNQETKEIAKVKDAIITNQANANDKSAIDSMSRSTKKPESVVKVEVTANLDLEITQKSIDPVPVKEELPIQKPIDKPYQKPIESQYQEQRDIAESHIQHQPQVHHPKLPPILNKNPEFPDPIKLHKVPRAVFESRFGLPPPRRKPEPEVIGPPDIVPRDKEKAMKEYFTVRDTKVNAFDFRFLAPGDYICQKDENVFLVMAALTTYYAIKTRETIRATWGSIAQTETWPGIDGVVKGVKLVFLLGNPEDHAVKHAIIKDETERFGDIVVADFTDSYYNLTYKVMMALKWTNTYCPQAKFVVKVDEDMFLHVVNLIRFLRTIPESENGEVIGYRNTIPKVLRTGIWGVPWEVYPFTRFPDYTNGNCYVIGGTAISKMMYASERLPYIFIEDAFLTGVVRHTTNTSLVHNKGFARWGDKPPRLCSFHNTHRIAATSTDDQKKKDIWKALHFRNVKNCYNITLVK